MYTSILPVIDGNRHISLNTHRVYPHTPGINLAIARKNLRVQAYVSLTLAEAEQLLANLAEAVSAAKGESHA